MERELRVIVLGATGAVGSGVAQILSETPSVTALTMLGRRPLDGVAGPRIHQYAIDVFDPRSYVEYPPGHDSAVCTLGVGQPSKVSREEFVRLDKVAVLEFAAACKDAGVSHFELLGSVGANAKSRSFYLRTKGELEDGLRALGFERLSLFRPSMILTPTNRYGITQALVLAIWPKLDFLMVGSFKKYRGVPVRRLSQAMARNLHTSGRGEETLQWEEIVALSKQEESTHE